MNTDAWDVLGQSATILDWLVLRVILHLETIIMQGKLHFVILSFGVSLLHLPCHNVLIPSFYPWFTDFRVNKVAIYFVQAASSSWLTSNCASWQPQQTWLQIVA